MGDMTTVQRDAVKAMLAAALSPECYVKVQQIIEGYEVEKLLERGPGGLGRDECMVAF